MTTETAERNGFPIENGDVLFHGCLKQGTASSVAGLSPIPRLKEQAVPSNCLHQSRSRDATFLTDHGTMRHCSLYTPGHYRGGIILPVIQVAYLK